MEEISIFFKLFLLIFLIFLHTFRIFFKGFSEKNGFSFKQSPSLKSPMIGDGRKEEKRLTEETQQDSLKFKRTGIKKMQNPPQSGHFLNSAEPSSARTWFLQVAEPLTEKFHLYPAETLSRSFSPTESLLTDSQKELESKSQEPEPISSPYHKFVSACIHSKVSLFFRKRNIVFFNRSLIFTPETNCRMGKIMFYYGMEVSQKVWIYHILYPAEHLKDACKSLN